MTLSQLLEQLDTLSLQQPEMPTVALVVLNTSNRQVPPCRVRFSASFPTHSAKPVTIRDAQRNQVPSRIVTQTLTANAPGVPSGKQLWSLTLEFALLEGIAPQMVQALAATYEESETMLEEDVFPLVTEVIVVETDCHAGTITIPFRLPNTFVFPS